MDMLVMGCVVYILIRDYYYHRLLIRCEAVIMIVTSSHCALFHDSFLLTDQCAFIVDPEGGF